MCLLPACFALGHTCLQLFRVRPCPASSLSLMLFSHRPCSSRVRMHQGNERRDRHEWIFGLDEDMQRIIGAADNVIGHQELDAHPAYIELELREQALDSIYQMNEITNQARLVLSAEPIDAAARPLRRRSSISQRLSGPILTTNSRTSSVRGLAARLQRAARRLRARTATRPAPSSSTARGTARRARLPGALCRGSWHVPGCGARACSRTVQSANAQHRVRAFGVATMYYMHESLSVSCTRH